MHVLIVSQYFWPENFRINDLAKGLVERGHEVTVLTGIPNYPGGRYFKGYGIFRNLRQDFHGVKVIRVPLVPRGNSGGVRLVLNYLSFALFASALIPFVCKRKYDLIFVFEPSPITVGIPAIVLKKLRRVPIFFWVQDLWPESLSATGAVRSERIIKAVRKLVRYIYRECDRILIQSPAFASLIEKEQVEKEKIYYFPNSVEKIYTPTDGPLSTENIPHLPNGFRIMFAGNIGVSQDFGTIIAAADSLKEFPDIHWVILGDGRRFEWVKQQIGERGLTKTVHLLGRYPPESMPVFYAAADVMLVTLKKEPIFALTIPSKIQSYMAGGRPIIAALDGEGSRLVTQSAAGIAIPAEDPAALAAAVLTMYRMPRPQREEMGLRGKQYCEANFEREMLLDHLEVWLQEAKA